MKKPDNYIFVIFGGSGDLSKRKLVPALFNLCRDGLLPADYVIIGLGRKDYTDESYRQKMIESIKHHGRNTSNDQHILEDFSRHLYYHQFDMNQPGAGFNIKNVGMDFHYSDLIGEGIPEAYERLLLDSLLGDGTLYARADGVEAAAQLKSISS